MNLVTTGRLFRHVCSVVSSPKISYYASAMMMFNEINQYSWDFRVTCGLEYRCSR